MEKEVQVMEPMLQDRYPAVGVPMIFELEVCVVASGAHAELSMMVGADAKPRSDAVRFVTETHLQAFLNAVEVKRTQF
jgi:hypothetical protein